MSKTAFGNVVPWRDGGPTPGLQFSGDGHVHASGVEDPRAQWRVISPGFFAALGVPIVAGRDFNALDNQMMVARIIAIKNPSSSSARLSHSACSPIRIPSIGSLLDRSCVAILSRDRSRKGAPCRAHRIIGVPADIDDGHLVPEPTLTVYSPMEGSPIFGGRLFIHTSANPYSLVPPVTRIIRGMSADQPVEHAATLADVRAEVLAPDRLNSLVFGVFAAVALAIAVVGVAGVLTFSVSARTREFGIRLALGSKPQRLLRRCHRRRRRNGCDRRRCRRGIRVRAGPFGGKVFPGHEDAGRIASVGSAFVLMSVAVVAAALPAARAARVDVMQALRSE